MRFSRTSLSSFGAGRTGRLMLPVGFALVIAAGTYFVAESEGYERGVADRASAQESIKNLARLVAQPIELDDDLLQKADRLQAPAMIRAIEPASVYRPGMSAHAKSKMDAAKTAAAKAEGKAVGATAASAGLPTGVERFDRCGAGCDTRDPMIVRTSYPVVVSAPMEASDQTADRELPPAIVENRAQAEDDSFLGLRLPSLPSAGEMVDRTVAGTAAAYDGLKQSVTGAIDALR
ncbi:MAG: hypothetical protein K0S00_799 [Xanthobacteraceae bacterium]|jgi:hypothetical protein|nr:hypothetical protein [Xanthobacteraceae bacterium]